ncbi:DUF4826 family protein [Aestuariibacter sp. AA17]|uniref:DUF4826 family protein n=1 Tax=Fluctibacter corallii TaxID=2984329 RepID=A0ABT3A5B3_9ALTE|nr:DUF4826 family protein [Aestuariibacter sp. AA17]MCV2883893.1 DUF4826 family protein [Aestuariibacter sp. AA17]
METQQQMSPEEMSAWVREQFRKANKFLAEKGILFEAVSTDESRYLAPYVAIWKIKSIDGALFWVITGDVEPDIIPYETESNPRMALRHFSMRWQVEAENRKQAAGGDHNAIASANALITRAEGLYSLSSAEHLWK